MSCRFCNSPTPRRQNTCATCRRLIRTRAWYLLADLWLTYRPEDWTDDVAAFRGNIEVVTSKEQAVADALGSLRAEGLEPEPAVVVLMERWGRGEITDKEFRAAQKVIAAHGTLAPPADIAI
jgi:hypothetical protein